jgi:RNA polymerase sigma-70 factor, ECF subfamily
VNALFERQVNNPSASNPKASPEAPLSKEGFQRLVSHHGDVWFSACLRITRDSAEAEDALQEALAKSWSQRALFRGDAAWSTWVHRIALRCAIDVVRRRNLRNRVDLDTVTRGTEASDAVFSRALRGALATLTQLERLCFVLKHLEEWTLDEVAQELNLSVNSVKQALFRGVKKLRGSLALGRNSI